jgi:hypothetical protein
MSDAHEDLRLDPGLIEKIRDIVSRRNHIQKLIQKADSNKAKVKPDIYTKVMADYEEKMKTVAGEYEPVSEKIRGALVQIRKREKKLRKKIEANSDQVEELRFRCEVGEFSDEELKKMEGDNVRNLEELEAQIKIVEETYAESKKYLGEEDFEEAVRTEEPGGAGDDLPLLEEEQEEIISGPEEVISLEVEAAPPPPAGGDIDIPPVLDPSDDIDITLSDVDAATLQQSHAEGEADGKSSDTLEAPEVPAPAPPTGGEFEATIAFQQRSFLKLRKQEGGEETYLLGSEALTIGRNHKNDIVLLDRSISRKHAQVSVESSGKYAITDVSSGGGIYVNGERVKKSQLNNGDEIRIGDFQLSFVEEMG